MTTHGKNIWSLVILVLILLVFGLVPALVYTARGAANPGSGEVLSFTGKLDNYTPEVFLTKEDFTILKNFRYYPSGIGTRSGMAGYTSNAEPNGNDILTLFPFHQENKFHLITASYDPSGITYWNIEGQSFGAGVSLWYTTGSTATPVTHGVVRDSIAVGDVGGVTIWAGVSTFPTALLIQNAGVTTEYTNRNEWITDGESHSVASGDTIYLGYSRPFDAIQADKDSDTWDHSFGSSVTEQFKGGVMRYWSTLQVASGGSTIELPKILSNPRALGTHWDGKDWEFAFSAVFQKTGTSEFQDYTFDIADSSTETYMDISEMQSGGTIALGFLYKPRQVRVHFPENFKNETAGTSGASYFNGTDFVAIPGYVDGTDHKGALFAQTGMLELPRLTDWEKTTYGENQEPLYWMTVGSGVTIDNYVRIYKVTAIPDYRSPNDYGYTGVMAAHGRLWLFNGDDLSQVIVSAFAQPDVFVGADSLTHEDRFRIGRKEKVVSAFPFNDGSLWMKKTENWFLVGNHPTNFLPIELPGTALLAASRGVVVIDGAQGSFIVYMSYDGIYTISLSSTGSQIGAQKVSDDINSYWKSGSSLKIPDAWLGNSVGWFDRHNNEINFLVVSGSGSTNLNTQLVYSRRHGKWSTFDRDNNAEINAGVFFADDQGVKNQLAGGSGGTIYQLETGTSDYSYPIISDFTRHPYVLGDRLDGKNELRAMSFRYHLPDDSVVTGISVYLTPSLESNETEFSTLTSWIDRGWDYVNLADFRDNMKGFNHKIRVRVPSRINMLSQILWTQPAPWRHSRWGYALYSDEDGVGMLVDETGARILLDRE